MNNNQMKFAVAGVLFAVWGVLAYLGRTDMTSFITALTSTLAGLGVYHIGGPKE